MSLDIAPLRLPEPGPRYERENEAQTRRALTDIIAAVVAAASSATSGGASALADLTDVNLTSPANGAALVYHTASSKWIDGGVPLTSPIAQSDVTGLVSDLAAKAPLASPAFTGNPTAPTPAASDNDTSIATTAYVQTELASFSGTPTAPVAHAGTTNMECWYPAGFRTCGTIGSISMPLNTVTAMPFLAPARGGVIDKMAFHVVTGVAAKSVNFGIYDTVSATNLYPHSLLYSTTISIATNGRKEWTQTVNLTAGRLYWLVIQPEANVTIYGQSVTNLEMFFGVSPGTGISSQSYIQVSRTYASGLEATWSAGLNWLGSGTIPFLMYRFSS